MTDIGVVETMPLSQRAPRKYPKWINQFDLLNATQFSVILQMQFFLVLQKLLLCVIHSVLRCQSIHIIRNRSRVWWWLDLPIQPEYHKFTNWNDFYCSYWMACFSIASSITGSRPESVHRITKRNTDRAVSSSKWLINISRAIWQCI